MSKTRINRAYCIYPPLWGSYTFLKRKTKSLKHNALQTGLKFGRSGRAARGLTTAKSDRDGGETGTKRPETAQRDNVLLFNYLQTFSRVCTLYD